MKKFIFILLAIEIVISILVVLVNESVIIGNKSYNIVSSEVNLPADSKILCVIKNRFVFRDVTYKVYYSTNTKTSSTYFRLDTSDDTIKQLDKYSVSTLWYCLAVIGLTVLFYSIIVKLREP